jgi:hypothetical protein
MSEQFYKLTNSEFLKINELLKDAQLRVYLYLMTLNPWRDRAIEVDTAYIAEMLGLTRRTIQRAIKQLEDLHLVEIEITKFKIKHGQSKSEERITTHGSPSDTRIAKTTDGSPERQMDRLSDTRIAETTDGSPRRHTDRQRETEPLQDGDSSIPQTNKTNKTNKTTTDTHPTHPVVVDNDFLKEKKEDNLDEAIKKEIEALGIKVNPRITEIVMAVEPTVVEKAIAYVRDKISAGVAKNPAGYFISFLEGNWEVINTSPRQQDRHPQAPPVEVDPEFLEFYQSAIADGHVINRAINTLSTMSGQYLVTLTKPNQRGQMSEPWRTTQARLYPNEKNTEQTPKEATQGFSNLARYFQSLKQDLSART